ncbi:alpha/beta hydrolase [Natronomonas sp. EA1]|uniref:alpha/beta hydrolase n=1 Tax=Natronomonas sp. EA1 TaxID=3421655 RepID=UPI003EBDBF50
MDPTPTPGTVTAADDTTLRLWELVPEGADEAVCFLHGSITCSRALFAPPVENDDSYSWLHAAARDGRAAFALDVRGYGDSERPPEMAEDPAANPATPRADLAAEDVRAAFDHVRDRFETVHLVGVSWGTMTAGRFLADHEHDAASLAQVAPVYLPPWSFDEVAAALNVDGNLGAYYDQRYDAVAERQGGDDALFEAIWTTQVESGQGESADRYLVPAGALADTREACSGTAAYDARVLDLPTLVVRGSQDAISVRDDAVGLYDRLRLPHEEKEYLELGGADHYAMHGARRQELYDAVAAFQDRYSKSESA